VKGVASMQDDTRSAKPDSAVWMPFTQMKTSPPPLAVRAAQGIMLELEDGRLVMDCISSWWVTLHGHARSEIAAAISRQAAILEQVIPAGFTHAPAERLAHALVERLPVGLRRVFYSDNGSTAVEVALKMAFQYWQNLGVIQRTRFLAFDGAYHGDTLGAMSASARSPFTQAFDPLLFEVDRVPFPATHLGDSEVEEKEAHALKVLTDLLEANGQDYAGMIVEPLIQGAGGMRMCRPDFLVQLEKLLRRYGCLLIYDGVMTGFGRSGGLFACTKAGTDPDIVCLAKGLTGGFLPLAATVCSDEIFAAFYSDDAAKTFYHGHSYTANPLGCAAALASLTLLEAEAERWRRLEGWHCEEMAGLTDVGRMRRLRVCGTVAALDVVIDEEEGYLHALGLRLRQRFLDRGFLLRPLGNVLYVLPPYCIEREQLAAVYACMREEVERL